MKNKYEVSVIRWQSNECTGEDYFEPTQKYITYAKSEKQAINNIKFRNGIKEGCVSDNGVNASFINITAKVID